MLCNNFPWYPLTPSVYYTGMSYYEDLCKLSGYLNDIVEAMKSYDIDGLKESVSEIEKQQSIINKQIETLSNSVNSMIDNVNNVIELYHSQILGELASTSADLKNFVNVQLLNLRKYVDGQDRMILSEMQYQIQLLKNSLPELTNVFVVSPYTGHTITIQQAIDELWNNLRVYSLTADEYDSQQWTALEYDSFNLTAFEYDYFAKEYIYEDPRFYMFSPWTGKKVFYQNVIENLVKLHRTNAITASGYDSLTLTATIYDTKNISAYDYDWNGKTVLA